MKITLTTLSPVLFGSGEGGALVNVDLTTHETGFPFVPGRTLKGLLRESFLEVMEITGQGSPAMLRDLFGESGHGVPVGKLRFPNLYLPGWTELQSEVQGLVQQHPEFFHPHNVRRQFTREIPQTAMKNGVAKPGSLRMYRVLNPMHTFEGFAQIAGGLTPEEEDLLKWAAQNLRAAGTRRNKGFGKIKVEIDFETKEAPPSPSKSEHSRVEHWEIAVETLAPILIPDQRSDQNTVNTYQHIPGSVIRGVLANRLIQSKELGRRADEDELFYETILSEAVTFGPLFKNGKPPLALNVTLPKGEKHGPIYDSLPKPTKEEANPAKSIGIKLRPVKGFGEGAQDKETGQRILQKEKVRTEFMFHNSRPDRTAGRQTGLGNDSQGIFYYESISGGQTFTGSMSGPADQMQELVAQTGHQFDCLIGKSRSAQYGRARVTLRPASPTPPVFPPDTLVDLVCLSPLILLNAQGLGIPSVELLEVELVAQGLPGAKVEYREVKFQPVATYNNVWKSKSEQEYAFQTGSVFRLRVGDAAGEALRKIAQTGLGVRRNEGFGQVRWAKLDDFPNHFPKKTDTEGSPKVPTSDHPILAQFIERSVVNARQTQVRLRAIRDAEKLARQNAVGQGISNSLRSRLLQLLEETQAQPDLAAQMKYWKEKLDHIEGRIAGRALKDAQLWDPLVQLKGYRNSPVEQPFVYWKSFMEALRLKNSDHA